LITYNKNHRRNLIVTSGDISLSFYNHRWKILTHSKKTMVIHRRTSTFRAARIIVDKPDCNDRSVRKIAKEHKIHCSMLSRCTAKLKIHNKETEVRVALVNSGYQSSQFVSSPGNERALSSYLGCRSEIILDLTPMKCKNSHMNVQMCSEV
jgi:hypothetical protein